MVAVSDVRELVLTAVYHDSPDLRLARVGITLRHRVGSGDDGWDLKIPVGGPGSHSREEIRHPGPSGAVPAELAALLTAYLRGAPLGPRATLVTHRTSHELRGEDGGLLAELVDDRVEARTEDHPAVQFREIEVEDRGGGSALLDRVGDRLKAAGAVAGEFQPKVVRALGNQATAAPDPPPPRTPSGRDPARVLIAAVLRKYVRRMLEHDVAVRLEATDAVHQMRVDVRRLRAALSDFSPLLDPAAARRIRDELRWLGDGLAGGRDAEVVQTRLAQAVEELPPGVMNDQARRVLLGQLAAERATAEEPIKDLLAGDRYVTLLKDLVDAAAHPRTTDRADRPCTDVLPPVLRTSWRRLVHRVAVAQASADPSAYHRVRIAAKRTRYLAATLQDLYGLPASRLARDLERVQDVLGEHQDAIAAGAALLRAVGTPRVGRATFSYGVLYALQEQAAERARAEFNALWPKVARRKVRKWVEDPNGR